MDDLGLGNIKNNTSNRIKEPNERNNAIEKKKIFQRAPFLDVFGSNEDLVRYFKPVVFGDSRIEDVRKESEENSVRTRQSQDDNKTPKDRLFPSFYDAEKINLGGNLKNSASKENIFSNKYIEELIARTRQSQDDKTPEDRFFPSLYDADKINLGGDLKNSASKENTFSNKYFEELIARQKELLEGIKFPWDDPSKTPSYKYPYNVDYKPTFDFGQMPDFDPPKVNFGNYSPPVRRFPNSGIWFIALVAVAVIVFVIKLIARPRGSQLERRRQREQQPPVLPPAGPRSDRPRNNAQRRRRRDQQDPSLVPQQDLPYGSAARLVSSDFSAEGPDTDSDLPPTYAECATNNNDNVYVHIDQPKVLIADEPPPPYSACLGLLSNSDDDSAEKPQSNQMESSFVTDAAHSNVMETSCTINVEERNNNIETSRFTDS